MSKHLTILFFCLCLCISMASAQGYDHFWITGTHEYPGVPGYDNAVLRFRPDGKVDIEVKDLKMNFESTVAAVSDSSGSGLLFYTNGCYVATANGDTMPGSTGLNPGEMHDWVCGKTGYVCPRGAMILPMPGHSNQYYIFHMGARYDPVRKLTYGPFYCSVVDMNLDNGKGEVTSKNTLLTDGDLEPFTAVRHGNGRDWWVMVPEYASNRYQVFLLDPLGVSGPYWQEIGPVMDCRRIGSSTFSLRGSKFARAQNCQVAVLDFDRCTGAFSKPVLIDLPDHAVGGGGVAFSPDEKHLLASTQLQIFQADLSLSSPKLDTAFVWNFQWGVSLQHMQYTPYDQVFLNHMHRTAYLSTIDYPNAIGSALGFRHKGLPLPVTSVRTLPNAPNFRLGDLHGSPCDTLGITPTAEPLAGAAFAVMVSPNPARDEVTLRDLAPESVAQERGWRVFSATGQVLRSAVLPPGTVEHRLDLGGLPPGLYGWEMARNDGSRTAGRVVVMR